MKDFTNGLLRLPSKADRERELHGESPNPIKLARMLSAMDWAYFFCGWAAWTMDAWDFFAVSLSLTNLAKQLDRPVSDITTAITLTLLFRSVGAILFGVISDRFGRKWPLVANLLLIAAFSLGSGYIKTYSQFLVLRSFFGIGMGGIWGLAAANALENMPIAARGLFSGLMQQGYATGAIFATCVNLTWVEKTGNWRILFFLGAGLSAGVGALRAVLPESPLFVKQKAEREARMQPGENGLKAYGKEVKEMAKTHTLRFVWAVCLMAGMNFLSHASQDLYPTMLQKSKLLSAKQSSRANIIANVGAVCGGLVSGFTSQYLGRRLTMIMFIIMVAALIPAWILPNSFSGLAAGAFFLQFGVQGTWGVIPVYLSEISPAAFRAAFSGVAYQLGNAASAGSSQIEAVGGSNLKTLNPKWTPESPSTVAKFIPAYAKVSAILLGAVCAFTICVLIVGPEKRGGAFDAADSIDGSHKADAEEFKRHVGQHVADEDAIEHVGDQRYAGTQSITGSEEIEKKA